MENKKVSSKSTKVELLEALAEREKEIEELKKLTDDPKKEQEKAEKERGLESSAEAINSNVFSDETKIQYRDVMTAIELKKTELKDLYGIEANAQTLTAMINASKVKKAELVQEYADKEIELKVAYEAKKEEVAADTAKLVLDYKKKKEELEDDFKQVRDASNRQHIRAEEEYEYDLSRKKQEDADKWNDEKVAREKLMTEKEADLQARMLEFAGKEDHLKDLEEQVAAFPDKLGELGIRPVKDAGDRLEHGRVVDT